MPYTFVNEIGQVAGHYEDNLKPSDILLAVRNNSNKNNIPYKSAAHPEPTKSCNDGCIIPTGPQHTRSPPPKQPPLQQPQSQPPLPPPSSPQQQQTQLKSTAPTSGSPLHQASSNVSSNNCTNKQISNQSSASRKKNRRIGRHESRYTSGNKLYLILYIHLSI